MNKNLKENSKKLGISVSYLSDILNGKKGCAYWLMKTILKYYPNLKETDFKILNPRYILRRNSDE